MNPIPEFDCDARSRPMEPQLACPYCGHNNNLRHERVTIYAREEDASTGTRVSVLKQVVSIDTNVDGNPSPNRGGLIIGFYCEQCGLAPALEIHQHKGNTYMRWVRGEQND